MHDLTNQHETLLKNASDSFRGARKNLMEGAAYLHEIEQTDAWELHYSSFGEFIESECQMSRSAASKLVLTYKFYVLDNGVSPAKLETIGAEKLYAALQLEGSAEKKLAMAETLSRSELRTELKDPNDTCLHEETYTICRSCNKRL